MASASFVKSNIIILVFTFLGIILNFVSQLVLAYFYGTTVERDVFFSASVISTYVITVVTTSVSAIFLPSFVEVRIKKGEGEANHFSRSFLAIFICFLLFICCAIFFNSSFLVATFYPSLNQSANELLVDLLNVLIVSVFLQCFSGILAILYNARNRFFISAVNPIVNTISIIITVMVLHKSYGILSVAYGTIIGNFINALLLTPQLTPVLTRPFIVNFKDEKLRATLRVISLLILTNVVIRLAPVLERIIAAGLSKGSISFLGYANQIVLVLITLTSNSIATTIFPLLSKSWAEKKLDKLSMDLESSIRILLFLSIPIASIFLVFGSDIIQLAFERGKFGPEATSGVSKAISCLLLFFISASLGNVIFKIFYITKQTKVFVYFAFIEIGTYVLLAYWLISYFSYLGLALALSGSSLLNVSLGIFYLSRQLKIISLKTISFIFAEYLLVFFLHFLIMLGVSFLFTGVSQKLPKILLELGVGNMCFLALAYYLLKNKELRWIFGLLLQKVQKN